MIECAAATAEAVVSLPETLVEVAGEGASEVGEMNLPKVSGELGVLLENASEQVGELDWLDNLPEELQMSAACENSSELQQLDAYQKILDEQENLDPAVKQAYQDKIDACKDAVGKINDGTELTNAQKGNLGEMMMDLEYLKDGKIRIGDLGITELNQSGHNGIDGVYESTNPPPQYIIADAKYGSSQLNKETNDGPQMSENWIDKRLDAAVGKDKADEIRLAKLMDPDSVKSQLVKISPTGDIQILPIDEAGNIQKGGNINA